MIRWTFGLMLSVSAMATDTVLMFEPARTSIHWTLGTVLHTVHGTFQLKSGTIHFDRETGKASGQLVVSATSGESGNESRDKRMQESIIESPKFGEIVFNPDMVLGQVAARGKSTIQVHGSLQLHGAGHDFTMPVQVDMNDGQASAKFHLSIPYIKWGLKNPSTFLLRVNDTVDIDIEAAASVKTQ